MVNRKVKNKIICKALKKIDDGAPLSELKMCLGELESRIASIPFEFELATNDSALQYVKDVVQFHHVSDDSEWRCGIKGATCVIYLGSDRIGIITFDTKKGVILVCDRPLSIDNKKLIVEKFLDSIVADGLRNTICTSQ